MTQLCVIYTAVRSLFCEASRRLVSSPTSAGTVGGVCTSSTTSWYHLRRTVVDIARLDADQHMRRRGRRTYVSQSPEVLEVEQKNQVPTQPPVLTKDVINGGGDYHGRGDSWTEGRFKPKRNKKKKKRDELYRQQHSKQLLFIPEEEWPR